MFTGIIQASGSIVNTRKTNLQRRSIIEVDPKIAHGVPEGGSVAIDGVCLTTIHGSAARGVARESARRRSLSAATPDTLAFELMDSTLKRTTLGLRKVGDRVNVEPAMLVGQPIGGHFISGHVDGVGVVRKVTTRGRTRYIVIAPPQSLMSHLVPQGSIAINGVSLTVVEVGGDWFSLALTSYTAKHTNLGALKAGDKVNIETDMFAKYILKFLNHYTTGYAKISHRRGKI